MLQRPTDREARPTLTNDILGGIKPHIPADLLEDGAIDKSVPPHLAPCEPAALGQMFLSSGSNLVFRGDGFLSTCAAGDTLAM